MVLEYGIVFLLVAMFVTVLALLLISGLCSGINIAAREPPLIAEGFTFVFKIHDGPSSDSGYLFNEIFSIDPNRIQCCIQYTKDGEISAASTHTAVGAILPTGTSEEVQELFQKNGFTVTSLPAISEALVVSFPHTSFLSISLATRRVYPALRDYANERDLPLRTFIEIYTGEAIQFVALLRDDNLYKVTECSVSQPITANAPVKPAGELIDVEPEPEIIDCASAGALSSVENDGTAELEASFEKVSMASVAACGDVD